MFKKLFLPSKQELIELYINRELSAEEIGGLYGISTSKVRSLCKSNEITLRETRWRQTLIATNDGHFVKSIYEAKVDNWLFENRIPHEYEPKIPSLNSYKADFLALNHYIEIWGVKYSKAYLKRRDEKREIYRQKELLLIEISHIDFQSLSWREILAKFLL